MELTKRKYKKAEVENILFNLSNEYRKYIDKIRREKENLKTELFSLNQKLDELSEELKEAKSEIRSYEKTKKLTATKKVSASSRGRLKGRASTPKTTKEQFNPKKKIAQFIAQDLSGGIDLNEVTKIDDSKLGDICKELGLTEN